MWTLANGSIRCFYLRLAWGNVKRSREIYLPYALATAIMAGVYFLILALMYSPGLANVPGGETTRMMFMMGITVFTLFVFGFMMYINGFLMKRRKKEFGLYGVLGLEKRHVCRVLCWENAMVIGIGVVTGVALGMVLGRLLFMVLLNLIRAAGDSTFVIPPVAYCGTALLFFAVFVAASLFNSVKVRLARTVELLKGDQRGEKTPKTVLPGAILGFVLLASAYYTALTVQNMALALALFFLAVLVVIVATYLLFHAGSIAVLRGLRKNRRIYYQRENFVAISGMFHRMRQNASGLATICILSTMLMVTVSGTVALYAGQQEIARALNPMDVYFSPHLEEGQQLNATQLLDFDEEIAALAAQYGVRVEADESALYYYDPTQQALGEYNYRQNYTWVTSEDEVEQLPHCLRINQILAFNLKGDEDACEMVAAQTEEVGQRVFQVSGYRMGNIYEYWKTSFPIFGGLLFLGAFFAVLFLAITVLIIYFKQITEGMEDKGRFEILQKVGMDEDQVKKAINRQILWVFFLPLIAALCHTLVGGVMVTKMMEVFSLYNSALTFGCILITCGVFAVVYLLVYRQTARVYYRIVKR